MKSDQLTAEGTNNQTIILLLESSLLAAWKEQSDV